MFILETKFRRALIAAAKTAENRGIISDAEVFKIRGLTIFTATSAGIESLLHEQAVYESIIQSKMLIDWEDLEKWMEFLIKWIPIIIDLFT